jgi:ribonuclease J
MQAIGEAPARVLVATFASLISRIQLVLDAAEAHGRKVAVAGRRMVDNVAMASEMGYIKPPPGVLVSLQRASQLPPEQVVLITTGSQGEPSSALVRIARDDHRQIRILPQDTVIISASAIPGNEKVVNRTINNLVRRGARVLYDRIATVHVHGHAAREELKTVLTLTKPRCFVPIHGEFRGLAAHAALARQMGVKEDNVFLMQDGDVLELSESGGRRLEKTTAGNVYLDGRNAMDPNSPVLEDRRALGRDGVVIIVLSFDRETGIPLEDPTVVSSGFTEDERRVQAFNRLAAELFDSLDREARYPVDETYITQKVKKIARRLLYKDLGRRPMIVPVTLEV